MAFIQKDKSLGEIALIRPSIMRDVDILLEYIERTNKKDEELQVADSAARVETYLTDYREAEEREKDI